MGHTPSRVLECVRERKLADLLPPPRTGSVLEASGVVARGREYFVVFDNIRRAARIGASLIPGSKRHAWVGRTRQGEGYEDIAYSEPLRRFYLLIEAEKHPDGTFKAVIEEYDSAWRYRERRWVNYSFEKRNRGFEGLSAARWQRNDFLLALCEGNYCLSGRPALVPGGGRIQVLRREGALWQPVAEIKLPRKLNFKDYSAVSLRGDNIAVVSQKSSRLWIGKLRYKDWTIVGAGQTFEFPRTKQGKRLYCTVEGLGWLSASTFVMVSDLSKDGYPDRCGRTDQSIHVFRFTA